MQARMQPACTFVFCSHLVGSLTRPPVYREWCDVSWSREGGFRRIYLPRRLTREIKKSRRSFRSAKKCIRNNSWVDFYSFEMFRSQVVIINGKACVQLLPTITSTKRTKRSKMIDNGRGRGLTRSICQPPTPSQCREMTKNSIICYVSLN